MTSRFCILTALALAGFLTSTAHADIPPAGFVPAPVPPLAMPVEERLEPLLRAANPRVLMAALQPPTAQEEFKPIDELPPEEKLPAAPLLVSAYVIVSVLLFAYVYSLSRRLGTVKAEVARLEADLKRSGRA